jgi:aspartyl-tRNA(Asn)/glutamyl-tRNA(Gln) amidotransferase subunit A
MGRTVADVALLTSVMAGQHPVDHASWGPNGQMVSLEGGVQGLRIGLATRLGDFPVSRAVVHNTHAVATALESASALEGLARLEPRVYRCFEAGL